jgi:hypothetical protein
MTKISRNHLFARAYAVVFAFALCLTVFGTQALGQLHGLVHIAQEQQYQAQIQGATVFDELEQTIADAAEKSSPICKLLDSLLLGACAAPALFTPYLLNSDHFIAVAIPLTSFAVVQIRSYYSQAPPQTYL